MLHCLVAYTHGFIAHVSFQVQFCFFKVVATHYGIEWVIPLVILYHKVGDKMEIPLRLFKVSYIVKSIKYIIGIAQPAITIIPGAPAHWEFRKACSARCDNGSRIFILVYL